MLYSLSWAGFRQLKMIIFTTYFMCQPDVICGHFWKGSLCGGYKTSIFLWETGLLSVIKKTHATDLLLYACCQDRIGLPSHHLCGQRSIQIFLLHISVSDTENQQNPSGWWKRNEYQLPTVLLPKDWFAFCKLSTHAIVKIWLTQDLGWNYLSHGHASREHNSICTALSLFFMQANWSAFLNSVEMIQNGGKEFTIIKLL